MSLSFDISIDDILFENIDKLLFFQQESQTQSSKRVKNTNNDDNEDITTTIDLYSHSSDIHLNSILDDSIESQIGKIFADNSTLEISNPIVLKLKKVSNDNKIIFNISTNKTYQLFSLNYENEFHDLIKNISKLMSPSFLKHMNNNNNTLFHIIPFTLNNLKISFDKSNNRFTLDFKLSFKISVRENLFFIPNSEHLKILNSLIELLYIPNPTDYQIQFNSSNSQQTVSSFYTLITENTRNNYNKEKDFINIPGINKTLLPFQLDTLKWMLKNEGKKLIINNNNNNNNIASITIEAIKYPNNLNDNELSSILDSISPGWTRINNYKNSKVSYWYNQFNGGICTNEYLFNYLKSIDYNLPPAKGFLCEEMGLGKTLEITSLINLNPRLTISNNFKYDILDNSRKIKQCKSTLIICPETILNQWIEEINSISPNLKVFNYLGISLMEEINENLTPIEVANDLANYDIILTSYSILANELNRALFIPTTRPKRKSSNYDRIDYSSPLMLLEFYRLVLDEAQLASISISNVAKFSRILPRIHTWCVSGTLIRKNLNDLNSLIKSQRLFPYDLISIKQWEELPRFLFDRLFLNICIRHTKEMIGNQINLPKQSRIMLRSPFSSIENDNYQYLFNRFLEQVGLNENGEPIIEGFDLDKSKSIMRMWYNKLRIICCHALLNSNQIRRNVLFDNDDIIELNSKDKNKNKNKNINDHDLVIGTLDDVLKDLISNNESESHLTFTSYIKNLIKIGKIREFLREPQISVKIFEDIINKIQERIEYYKCQKFDNTWNSRIKLLLDYLRQSYFLLASAHYQHYRPMKPLPTTFDNDNEKEIKEEEKNDEENEIIDVNSLNDEEKKHYYLENEYYEKADNILNQLLEEPLKKCSEMINKISKVFEKLPKYNELLPLTNEEIDNGQLSIKYELPLICIYFNNINEELNTHSTTLEISFILNRAKESMIELNTQAIIINYWFKKLFEYQKIPVVKNEDSDKTGEEYKLSLISQEESQAYIDQLQLILEDREKAINVTEDSLTYSNNSSKKEDKNDNDIEINKNKMKRVFIDEKSNDNSLTFKLEKNRKYFAPQGSLNPRYSFRTSIVELVGELQLFLPNSEQHQQIENMIKLLKEELKLQMNNLKFMKHKLFDVLNDAFNSKISYFKQLQIKSDTLINYEPEKISSSPKYSALLEIEDLNKDIEKDKKQMNLLNARLNYLKSLNTEREINNNHDITNQDVEDKSLNDDSCVICRYRILIGTLTPCGHKYCRECLNEWMKTKQVCPLCQKRLKKDELYNFTYSKGGLKGEVVESIDGNNEEIEDKKENELDGEEEIDDYVYDENEDINRLKLLKNRRILEKDMDFVYQGLPTSQLKEISNIKLKKNYGTKVDMIIRQIKYLKQKEPEVQILIFSQWNQFLLLLGRALKIENVMFKSWMNQSGNDSNRLNTTTTNNNKNFKRNRINDRLNQSINEFKKDKNITCFLLNTFAHAAGLTFTNASHVFLCEPMVNLSFELQAINRIHRIGQIKETKVWNFIIEGSIEESIAYLGTKKRIQTGKVLKKINKVEKIEEINEDLLESKELTKINDTRNDGEVIADEDLWASFFAAKSAKIIDNVYK